MTKSQIVFTAIALTALTGALALPVSNFFVQRKLISDKSGDPRFVEVSKIMQASCADCHAAGLTSYPIYAQLPIARDLIDRDISEAQQAFNLSVDQLSGAEKIGSIDLAKIATVVKDGSMPPLNYTAMHWNAALHNAQKDALLAYVQARQDDDGSSAIVPVPKTNPFHVDANKAKLGEKLFFDKRLSQNNALSCASCHDLKHGGPCDKTVVDADFVSNVPTVFNSAFNFRQFADGHALDLNAQAKEHIESAKVLNGNFSNIIGKLGHDPAYGALSEAAYKAPLNQRIIVESLAAYEKTLITPDCAFDLYLEGDQNALDSQEKQGYQLFMEKNCAACHGGVAMGGNSLAKVSGKRIKVPLLRNIALTGPYFHDGSAKTLGAAVDIMAQKMAGSKLTTSENEAIVAFLHTLTGKYQGQKLHL